MSEMKTGNSLKRRQRRQVFIIMGGVTAIAVAMFGMPVGFCILLGFRYESNKRELLRDVDHSSIASAALQMLDDESLTGPAYNSIASRGMRRISGKLPRFSVERCLICR